MWPARHSASSRTSTICTSSAAAASSSTLQRPMLATSRPSARQLVMPPARKPPSRRTPMAVASRPATRASSSSRPTSTISCSRSATHASFVPKPWRSIVMQTAPGMCASSNCRSVRTSTTSAPCARRCSTWRGVSGSSSTPAVTSGPRFMSTTAWKLGGCGPRFASAASTNSSSSRVESSGLWRSS